MAPRILSDNPRMPAKRKSPPYPFILEALDPLHPEVKPMFSGYAVYLGDKIVCMLRDRPTYPEDNGLWLVFSETADLAHKSIRKDFPSLRPIGRIGGVIAHWLLIPADSPNFESEALHVCDLLLKHDPRLGRIPKSRSSSPQKKKSPQKPKSS
jgi:hypothetical protein